VLKVPNAALRVRMAGVEPAAAPAGPADAPAAAAAAPAANNASNGTPRVAGQSRPGASGRGPSQRGRIFLLDAQGKPQAYDVRLGVSDGTATEVLVRPDSPGAAAIVEGATVITGVTGGASASATPARAAGPRMPF
jgi:HlyD family secretion protein